MVTFASDAPEAIRQTRRSQLGLRVDGRLRWVPAQLTPVPTWDRDELKAQRDIAQSIFTRRRREEGPRAFAAMYGSLRQRVEAVFDASDDLRELSGRVFLDDPDAWQACRYVCGPPISQEDLWTLVGGPKFKRVPAEYADDTAEAIRVVIDSVRFPWVEQGRAATAHERETAVLATTVLWAAQQLGTARRQESSTRQEALTGSALLAGGLQFEASRTPITFIDDLARGFYCKERGVAGAKCDVPARLKDGRLLALECKVSNGPKNGWKRLNLEVGGKAEKWRGHFGSHQVVTAVVLAGVIDLASLIAAQRNGVVLFWEHDLEPLTRFVAEAL